MSGAYVPVMAVVVVIVAVRVAVVVVKEDCDGDCIFLYRVFPNC